MRQYLDPELLNFASMLVREQIEKMSIKWKFNGKSIIKIAKTAVSEDKIQDENWIRGEIKKLTKKSSNDISFILQKGMGTSLLFNSGRSHLRPLKKFMANGLFL